MRALIQLKENLHYRRDAFEAGARALGFEVVSRIDEPQPDDLLVIWNRYGHGDLTAKRFEAVDAAVIVAENGYMGKDWLGQTWYAMSLNHHNGAGGVPYKGPERWQSIGFELAPMRKNNNGEVVLLPQRGIGEPGVAMPGNWEQSTLAQFKRARVRKHPGKNDCIDVVDDCANALCVVTWGSGAGIKCMAAGIPCITNWPKWIGASGCGFDDNRLPMFERLAWAQWRIEEIKSGEAFNAILGFQ